MELTFHPGETRPQKFIFHEGDIRNSSDISTFSPGSSLIFAAKQKNSQQKIEPVKLPNLMFAGGARLCARPVGRQLRNIYTVHSSG